MAELSYLQDVSPKDERIFATLKTMVVDKKPLGAGYERLIHKCRLFGQKLEPSEIWERYGRDQAHGEQLLFFSELKRSGKNISRKIGRDGSWSESGSKEIMGNTNPNPIGRKRKFRFENKCNSADHARWLLEEYSLYDAAAAHDNTKASKNRYDFDFVICKMRRNPSENKIKRSNDPNTNNVEEPQMAETLEDVPMRSVGSAWLGGPLQDHYPLTCPALDFDHYQMAGNQEEQQPLPTLTTAGPARFEYEYGRAIEACLLDECGGAIEADYQNPSNYYDMLLEVPYGEGTSNYYSESPRDIQLWGYQH